MIADGRGNESRNKLAPFGDNIWRGGKGWVLITIIFGWFLVLGSRLVFPALLPYIREDFALTHTTAGLLITLLWLAYALTQFPGGVLGDKYGEKRVLTLASLLGALSLFAVTISPTFWMFVLATILYGLGSGIYATPRVTLLTKIYTDAEGTVLGLVYAGGNIGTTVLPATAGLLAVYGGWRLGFSILIPLFLLLFLILLLVNVRGNIPDSKSPQTQTFDRSFYVRTIKVVFRDPVISITGVMFLSSFAYQGLIGFYPIYLIEVKQIAASTAALIYALYFGSGIFFQFAVGRLSDTFGKRNGLVVITGVNSIGLVLLTLTETISGLIAITIALSVSLGVWPVTSALAVKAVPPEMGGSAFGLVRTMFLGLAATSPFFVGLFFDSNLFDAAIIGLALAAAISFIISLHLRKNREI